MEEHLGKDECIIYYGLRADEDRVGYVPFRLTNLVPAYPLREAGIDLLGVFSILDAQNLAPPMFFWPRMHAAVNRQMAHFPGWEDHLSRIERGRLFAGRTRANCFFCFYQRQYEFLWLRETHPDLFAVASSLEKEEYSFQQGFFLRDLDDPGKRDQIFNRRVKEVSQTIYRRLQGDLFLESGDTEIALISCGLLCGK